MPTENKQTRQMKQIMTMNIGTGFGELALQEGSGRRSATIITKSKVDLIVIDRKTFQIYIHVRIHTFFLHPPDRKM